MKKILLIAILISTFACIKAQEKHRLIVLIDIGNDPDDKQTLVRLLLYSNQINIEGIIATTSVDQQTNAFDFKREEYEKTNYCAYLRKLEL